jgi:hypothetical protein
VGVTTGLILIAALIVPTIARNPVKALTFAGLVLDVIGVVFVSREFYQLVWGPVLSSETKLREQWLTQLDEEEKWIRELFDPKNNVPNTGERSSKYLEHYLSDLEVRREATKKQFQSLRESYSDRGFKWGIRGLLLLVLGFIFQAAAVLLT